MMVNPLLPLVAAICLSCLLHPHLVGADGKDSLAYEYLIGAGRYDITGPAAEVNMMGYANPVQTSRGIHLRQWSRAFIIADTNKTSRVVFVSIDACMSSQILKIRVVEELKKLYSDLYFDDNVLISGTHTHSTPAGFFQYVLFEVTSLGFVKESLDALVEGVVESIKMAHEDMREGSLYVNSGELLDANINRSPTSYLNNPSSERARYKYNTDKEMVLLKMVDKEGKGIGMIDWFAVHCTSMNNTNRLISSDNKGYASLLMEQSVNGEKTLPGQGSFVAAFAQSNLGDVSPNTKGPHCIDTGKPCDTVHSTCDGKNEKCIASGPGKDMFDSTRIIGEKQFNVGKELYEGAKTPLTGPVDYRHQFLNMSDVQLLINGKMVHTCLPAMGYSFAAGTTDGPGAFNFEQGTNSTSPFWNFISHILHDPSQRQIDCHKPKPILLDTGEITWPYPWQASILQVQLLRIGQLVIVGVPAEFTTMSGRRTREIVKKTLEENGFKNDTVVVIAGLSNTYSDYVTTFEEYQEQRYEGGSTVYGPYTLDAYLSAFANLSKALATGQPVSPGPSPPNYLDQQLSFLLPVVADTVPLGAHFGDVTQDVEKSYTVNQTVEAVFRSGNPRNNLMTNKTFLTVELKDESTGNWNVVQTDGSWDTRFYWEKHDFGESFANITWGIPPSVEPGTYRIQHFGYHKPLLESIKPYSGTTSEFKVTT